jgi:hypothetical protein
VVTKRLTKLGRGSRRGNVFVRRHCERSEAIQSGLTVLDCFVASLLAMTSFPHPRSATKRGRRKECHDQTNTAKLDAVEYAARLSAEKAALQQHYYNAFKFWRMCPLRGCRRARGCSGDAAICLRRRQRAVTRELQWQARHQILLAAPADTVPAERTVRAFLPGALV